MNKSIYVLAVLAFIVLFYNNYNSTKKDSPILFKAKTNHQYATSPHEYKGDFVGTYKASTIDGNKELILDSTYTYSCIIGGPNDNILLEGTWELSYKDSSQHIILSAPIAKTNSKKGIYQKAKQELFSTPELKLAITKTGILKNENLSLVFIKSEIESKSLAVSE